MPLVARRVNRVFGENVALDTVEALVAEVPRRADHRVRAVVDLSRCRHIELGAGVRLGNALARWSRGGEVTVLVPDPGDFTGGWFQSFTKSGLGLSLATHADRVLAEGKDITEVLRSYYEDRGAASSNNYGVATPLDDGAWVPDLDGFSAHFRKLGNHMPKDGQTWLGDERKALVTLCFEAIENVVDHAYRSPWESRPGHPETVSYFSMRFHRQAASARISAGGVRSYLSWACNDLPATEGRRLRGFIELIVSDDGAGIAARQQLDPDINDRDIQEEDRALVAALNSGTSIKLQAEDSVVRGDPGFGYTYIKAGLARLHAYAVLRTGRRLTVFDPSPRGRSTFEIVPYELGYLPGTILQVIVPRLENQLTLG